MKNKNIAFMSLVLVAVIVVAIIFSGKGHVYFEASAVLITIVIFGRLLEAKAKGKTSEAIKDLIGLQPKTANIIREGKELNIRVEDVKLGDIIIVKPGEKIPVDGRVIKGSTSLKDWESLSWISAYSLAARELITLIFQPPAILPVSLKAPRIVVLPGKRTYPG